MTEFCACGREVSCGFARSKPRRRAGDTKEDAKIHKRASARHMQPSRAKSRTKTPRFLCSPLSPGFSPRASGTKTPRLSGSPLSRLLPPGRATNTHATTPMRHASRSAQPFLPVTLLSPTGVAAPCQHHDFHGMISPPPCRDGGAAAGGETSDFGLAARDVDACVDVLRPPTFRRRRPSSSPTARRLRWPRTGSPG